MMHMQGLSNPKFRDGRENFSKPVRLSERRIDQVTIAVMILLIYSQQENVKSQFLELEILRAAFAFAVKFKTDPVILHFFTFKPDTSAVKAQDDFRGEIALFSGGSGFFGVKAAAVNAPIIRTYYPRAADPFSGKIISNISL